MPYNGTQQIVQESAMPHQHYLKDQVDADAGDDRRLQRDASGDAHGRERHRALQERI